MDQAIARLGRDARVDAVLIAGASLTGSEDEHSDVDLIVVCRDDGYATVMAERRALAASLGPLLAAFTGEHVGEPRLLICLYGPPVLHVDLKFVTREALGRRVETPLVAYDRVGDMPAVLERGEAAWPAHTPEWFEERFWIWVHYGATKIARGELFEAHAMLAHLRAEVLGPMVARNEGKRQRGVRRVELDVPGAVPALAATIAQYDRADCWRALDAAVALYREARRVQPPGNLRPDTEGAMAGYLAAQRSRFS